MELKRLLQPISIGERTIRNRVVMPPMVLNAAARDGYLSARRLRHCGSRAEGVGLIIVESTNVQPGGEIASHQLQVWGDRCIDGLASLAAALASRNETAFVQINHGGAKAFPLASGQTFFSASEAPVSRGQVPRSMSFDEIESVASAFAEAAARGIK